MRRLLAAAAVLLTLVAPATAQVVTPSEILRSSVHNVLRPGMKVFALRSAALEDAMTGLCATPSDETFATARLAFADAATAYGRIESVRIGPLMEDNRSDRLLFWPDRRGIGLRQVQAALATEDASATALDTLQQKSVAQQGFGALEFVLFGTGAETLATGSEYRCAYGATIAANISIIANDLVAGWADPEGIATHLTAPDPSYIDYRTQTEALEGIVGLVAHGVETVRDARLLSFISRDGSAPNPKQALFWRANLTFAMIRANLEGMAQLVRLSGIAAGTDLETEIETAFADAFTALDALSLPVSEAVTDPGHMAALESLVTATQTLQTLIGEKLSASLGLSVGFSSLDGD